MISETFATYSGQGLKRSMNWKYRGSAVEELSVPEAEKYLRAWALKTKPFELVVRELANANTTHIADFIAVMDEFFRIDPTPAFVRNHWTTTFLKYPLPITGTLKDLFANYAKALDFEKEYAEKNPCFSTLLGLVAYQALTYETKVFESRQKCIIDPSDLEKHLALVRQNIPERPFLTIGGFYGYSNIRTHRREKKQDFVTIDVLFSELELWYPCVGKNLAINKMRCEALHRSSFTF